VCHLHSRRSLARSLPCVSPLTLSGVARPAKNRKKLSNPLVGIFPCGSSLFMITRARTSLLGPSTTYALHRTPPKASVNFLIIVQHAHISSKYSWSFRGFYRSSLVKSCSDSLVTVRLRIVLPVLCPPEFCLSLVSLVRLALGNTLHHHHHRPPINYLLQYSYLRPTSVRTLFPMPRQRFRHIFLCCLDFHSRKFGPMVLRNSKFMGRAKASA